MAYVDPHPRPTSYVYFMRPVGMKGPIKIGCSFDPQGRLEKYGRLSPIPIELITFMVGDQRLERRLHATFAEDHSHHEWFRPSEPLLALIEAVRVGEFDPKSLPDPKVFSPVWPSRKGIPLGQRS